MRKTEGSRDLRASLQELARLGSRVDLSVADSDHENEKLEITQLEGLLESSIFELADGRAGYRTYLRITNQTHRTIYTPEVELRTSWEGDFFHWLQPLRIPFRDGKKTDASYEIYRFPGPSGLELEYDDVLNHVLLEDRCITPERPLEGWLLASGWRMPAELRHGQLVDVTLAIIGSDHTEYTQNIRLWTERRETRPKSTEKTIKPFDEPLKNNAPDAVRVPSAESVMQPAHTILRNSIKVRDQLMIERHETKKWREGLLAT